MNTNTTQNRLISYFLIVCSLFILLMFTKDMFFQVQALRDEQESITKKLEQKQKERTELKSLQGNLKPGLEKYTKELKENELVSYFYGLAKDTNSASGRGIVAINAVTIGAGVQNDLGFMESQIDLEVTVGSEAKMKAFLDALVAEDTPYKFFIDTFSYEVPEAEVQTVNGKARPTVSSYTVSIPLRFFYK